GGPKGLACGLTYISHIVPSALVLLALAVTRWPAVSGALLALGAGTVYYPAFFFPAMLGWFATARKGAALRFAAGFVVMGALLAAAIAAAVQLWKTQATGTYVEWYYPLLLIGLFADRPSIGIVSSVGQEMRQATTKRSAPGT